MYIYIYTTSLTPLPRVSHFSITRFHSFSKYLYIHSHAHKSHFLHSRHKWYKINDSRRRVTSLQYSRPLTRIAFSFYFSYGRPTGLTGITAIYIYIYVYTYIRTENDISNTRRRFSDKKNILNRLLGMLFFFFQIYIYIYVRVCARARKPRLKIYYLQLLC